MITCFYFLAFDLRILIERNGQSSPARIMILLNNEVRNHVNINCGSNSVPMCKYQLILLQVLKVLVLAHSYQASAQLLCSGGPGPPQICSDGGGGGGGGGGFSTSRGASFGQISILKIIIFLMIFLSFLIYSYDVASLNDTN